MVPSVGDFYRSTLHLLFPLNRLFALGVCLDPQRFDNYIPLLRLLRLLPEQCLSIDSLPSNALRAYVAYGPCSRAFTLSFQ